MGKRKQKVPQHSGEAKRQLLQWNMSDRMNGMSSFICDDEILTKDSSSNSFTATTASQLSIADGDGSPLHALCVDTFYQNLATCHSTVTLQHNKTDTTGLIRFGQFTVTLQHHQNLTPRPEALPECTTCWLYLSDNADNSMLYFEADSNQETVSKHKKSKSRQSKFGVFWFVSLSIPVAVLTNLKYKAFLLLCSSFDSTLKEFHVNIYGNNGLIMKLTHPSESLRVKGQQVAVQKLMDHFYNLGLPYKFEGIERTTGHDFIRLYESVMHIHDVRLSTDSTWEDEVNRIHHNCLKPTLRLYQKKSVAWMLRQERRNHKVGSNDDLHPLYCEVKFGENITLYYNRHGGSLIKDRPVAISSLPGGILADEMGLGKTVEVLCCMLLHTRPNLTLPEPLPIIQDVEESTLPPDPAGEVSALNDAHLDSDNSSMSSSDTLPADAGSPVAGGVASKVALQDRLEISKSSFGTSPTSHDILISYEAAAEDSGHVSANMDALLDGNETSRSSSDTLPADSADPIAEIPTLQAALPNNNDNTRSSSNASTTDTHFPYSCAAPENLVHSRQGKQPAGDMKEGASSNLKQSSCESSTGDCFLKNVQQNLMPSTNISPSLPAGVNAVSFINGKEIFDVTEDSHRDPFTSDVPDSLTNDLCSQLNSSKLNLFPEQTMDKHCEQSKDSNLFLDPAFVIKPNAAEHNSREIMAAQESDTSKRSTKVNSVKNFNTALRNGITVKKSTQQISLLKLAEPASLNCISESNSSEAKPKERKKSKGYVEYVPVSEEDSGYFTAKPMARKQFFECSCGQLDPEEGTRRKKLHTVKCQLCGMSQHAECMNYDLGDPYRGEYLCPHCHALHTTIESGATLIISPYSICHQWLEEIHKHIKEKTIKVFIYKGVSRLGYIQPQTLAQQDIVITTYDVLRKELDYVNLPHTNSETGRKFRHPKRFLATPSPLVAVEWWRICLDEAQMVECVTTKTAEMALRLKAVNRWCVTGTPLMRSVEDIFGLLLFLGVDPLMVHQWFRLLLWEPFCHGFPAAMHEALQEVFWRTAKKDVIAQIDLPLQTEEINWLTFSPVEEHFYRRQYEIYLRNAYTFRNQAQRIQDHSIKLHTLDRKTINELLNPLFRLRQACCHPQIVKGEFLPLNKSMMTMEELLDHMTKKVKTECEEAHRQIVASLNGMAGLAIINGKLEEAVSKYRDVLRSVEEHKDQFRTDDLQQLHAMHNLAEVLDRKPSGVSPTLRDATLRDECSALIDKYMSKTKASLVSSQEALNLVQKSVHEITVKLQSLDSDWWADVVDMTIQRGIENNLISKVKEDLSRMSTTEGLIADGFHSGRGMIFVIYSHLQSLTKAHKQLTAGLKKLAKDSSPALVTQAAACCLRPVDAALKTCDFCLVDNLFNEYESKLFLFVERGVTVAGEDTNLAYTVSTKRQGTWADSEVEKALKSIHSFYRQHYDTDSDILEAANLHLKYLDTLKKEFKCLRSVWLSHREMVSATDECDMATERLRLRTNFEPMSATRIVNVIEEKDIFSHQLKLSSDEIIGRDELKKKQGQLIYLKNLAKKSHDGDGNNPDLCPVCQFELGVEWSVLLCGHCFCLRCIRALIDRNLVGYHYMDRRLKCPLCRSMNPVRDISYVTTRKTEKVNVKGSHSTKVQAVLECLIKIREQDPKAKSLVFSVWVSVMDILAAALVENKIPYKSLHDMNYFQRNLSAFKTDESIQVLLLPLHTGANGLNLVEANHVLLVEPELNLEEESQAISRIYRIGQMRQTKIHRFLVRGTIEEKIYHMVKSLRESSSTSDGGESIELTVGHITSLLQQPGPEEGEEEMGVS